MERCFSEADRQAENVFSGRTVFGVGGITASQCGFRSIELCQFSDAPQACLGRSISSIEAEAGSRNQDLPQTIARFDLDPAAFQAQVAALTQDVTDEEAANLLRNYDATEKKRRPDWVENEQ